MNSRLRFLPIALALVCLAATAEQAIPGPPIRFHALRLQWCFCLKIVL